MIARALRSLASRALQAFVALAMATCAWPGAVVADDDGELIAVQPEQLPLLWTKTRGSLPSPWETFSGANDRSTKCVAVPHPRPPVDGDREELCGVCVAVGFIVEPDGSVSNVRALREVPKNPFTRHVVTDLRRWRFEPTARNAARTAAYSYLVYTHVMHSPMASIDEAWLDALARSCRLESVAP